MIPATPQQDPSGPVRLCSVKNVCVPLVNTARARYRPAVGEASEAEEKAAVLAHEEDSVSILAAERRRSWARLLRRIYEVDPLRCPCGGALRVVSVITDPVVVDRILAHRRSKGLASPFTAHAPPAA